MKFLQLSFFLSLLVAALFITASVGFASSNQAPQKPLVVGYYPHWSTQPAPEQLRFERFTHIIHAFATVDENGKPAMRGNVPSKPLTTAAHAAGVKVLLALGGGSNGENFGKMVRNDSVMHQFVKEIVGVISENGYDGLDIDWEFPGEGDEEAYVRFVDALHAELKAANPNNLLVTALPSGAYYGKWVPVARFKDKFDFVQIMTYDFHGPWSNHAGYNASLYESKNDATDSARYTFDHAIDYWLGRGFSKQQILVGIPFYGHGFVATAWGEKTTGKSAYPDVTFKQARQMQAEGWTRHWDAEAAVPWLSHPERGELISYDDEVSVLLKGAWAQGKGVGGVFFWNIAQDFIDGDHVLTQAARDGWEMSRAGGQEKLEAIRKSGTVSR